METLRKCKICGFEKSLENYSPYNWGDKISPCCKECNNKKNAEQHEKHKEQRLLKRKIERQENPGKFKERDKEQYEKHKEKRKISSKIWLEKNKIIIDEKNREYQIKNKDIIKEKRKIRYHTKLKGDPEYLKKNRETRQKRIENDLQYKLKCRLRSRMKTAVRRGFKSGSSVSDLGCSIEFLKEHLTSQFKEGMTWDNWGRTGWHIDHIVPLSAFDLSDREQFLKAAHYTNLQPLWYWENISKGGIKQKQ